MSDWKDALIDTYIRREAMGWGHFELAGGGTSDFYIDGRRVSTDPVGLSAMRDGMIEVISNRGLLPPSANLIAPIASGVPIGTAISLSLGRPFIMDRGKPKTHGKGQRFEGVFSDDPRCLVIDDLITAGSTLRQTIAGLSELGRTVTDVVIVVDREEGGAEALGELGVRLHALITKAELQSAMPRQA